MKLLASLGNFFFQVIKNAYMAYYLMKMKLSLEVALYTKMDGTPGFDMKGGLCLEKKRWDPISCLHQETTFHHSRT
jgi:hypothetical protein